jgi:queuine tRNA-ribosyltransferase
LKNLKNCNLRNFNFEILYKSKKSKARVGRIYTPHGIIDTPNFVGVGTNGTIKALDNNMASYLGLQLMFCNTYHLLLQPGSKVIKKSGGLHKFINRDLPIITDSGGFQVFSLLYGSVANELKSKGKKRRDKMVLKITEEGVLFRSYIDGEKFFLTPESSIEAQKDFGSDIILPLDELPPYHMDDSSLKKSMDRTHRWEKRSLKHHLKNKKSQAIYSIVHGGINKELRKKSALFLRELEFDGFAIGGSFGKNREEMIEMLKNTTHYILDGRPIHLLGMGDLLSLIQAVPLGIDTFDSSYPTKAARHGLILKKDKAMKISKKGNESDFKALDNGCRCFTCQNYNTAYLNHLFKAKELSFYSLASIHNIYFMVEYMKDIRRKILEGEI